MVWMIIRPGYWSLIGQEWSRDLETALWLVKSDHMTWILASDLLDDIVWPLLPSLYAELWPGILRNSERPILVPAFLLPLNKIRFTTRPGNQHVRKLILYPHSEKKCFFLEFSLRAIDLTYYILFSFPLLTHRSYFSLRAHFIWINN